MLDNLQLPAGCDMHIHLRDGPMCETVTPMIRQGGCNLVYVMPNLVPPITTTAMAINYRNKLEELAPDVKFLMSLYLHPLLSTSEIRKAKEAGVRGVKAYPAGVTTNSAAGVLDWTIFDPIFAEMQAQDLVLNIHGECPSDGQDITVINAEEKFLPTLLRIHQAFPSLRIVLEHCSSSAAIKAVKSCSSNVVGTITAHHLMLTIDDWAGDSMNWCKPAAKTPQDRTTLLQTVVSQDPQFFFGSDSAPHPLTAKRGGMEGKKKQAAGVFTSAYAIPLVLEALEFAVSSGILEEHQITKQALTGFFCTFGRDFYKEPKDDRAIVISNNKDQSIKEFAIIDDKDSVVPFYCGHSLKSVSWS